MATKIGMMMRRNLVVGASALDVLVPNLNFFAPNFSLLEPIISGFGAHNRFTFLPSLCQTHTYLLCFGGLFGTSPQ
jgi:hypothetical protein